MFPATDLTILTISPGTGDARLALTESLIRSASFDGFTPYIAFEPSVHTPSALAWSHHCAAIDLLVLDILPTGPTPVVHGDLAAYGRAFAAVGVPTFILYNDDDHRQRVASFRLQKAIPSAYVIDHDMIGTHDADELIATPVRERRQAEAAANRAALADAGILVDLTPHRPRHATTVRRAGTLLRFPQPLRAATP